MSSAGVAVSAEHDSSNLQPYTFYPEGGGGGTFTQNIPEVFL